MAQTSEGPAAAATPDSPPVLQIITPGTTPEEVAAIVAVLSAVGGGQPVPTKRPAPAWAAPRRAVRRALPHGPGGWRASGLPR